MKCPLTGKPCVKIKYISFVDKKAEGKHEEYLVCEECVHQTHSSDKIYTIEDDEFCSDCGISLSEIIKGSRMGCAKCYDNFLETMNYVISSLQGSKDTRHVGRPPNGFIMESARKTTREDFLSELRAKMENACSLEDYESAKEINKEIMKVKEGESMSDDEFALLVFEYRIRQLEILK